MSQKQNNLQVLEASEATSEEFTILGAALVSVEGIVDTVATDEALTAAITLADFEGARQLSFVVSGGNPVGGSITIAGDDAEGNAQTETLTFTMANETMTTANAYVSTGLTATPATYTGGTVTVTATVSGNWVVQSSRMNAEPRVWLNEFEPADALTSDIPIAEIQGSPYRVYRVTGGNAGVEGFVDDVFDVVWR